MHAFIQQLLQHFIEKLEVFGLLGVVGLMAMESSIFPVPSELVIPPAAYVLVHSKGGGLWESVQVVLAGTLGSFLGAAITYAVARLVGRPMLVKYGRYFFVPEHKLHLAEAWVGRYGAAGIFFSRLLPVVRHLIGIPAGLVRMRFRTFTLMTIIGSAIWCTILTIFGLLMSQDMETVIKQHGTESAHYQQAFQNLTLATVGMIVVIGVLYWFVHRVHAVAEAPAPPAESVSPTPSSSEG